MTDPKEMRALRQKTNKVDRLSPPRPKRELIESGAYCNKDHKDRDLPPKDDHIENDHVYCDWCPYYTMCDESVYYKEKENER